MFPIVLAIGLTLDSLIPLLIALVVICILIYAARIVIGMLSLPQEVSTLIWLAIAVVLLIVFLRFMGIA